MEGMDGLELTRRLLARIPKLKAIIVSAHLTDVAWWPEDLRGHPFLGKPFKNEQLVAAVRTALAG
jgi:FixJ family two-component response regulator